MGCGASTLDIIKPTILPGELLPSSTRSRQTFTKSILAYLPNLVALQILANEKFANKPVPTLEKFEGAIFFADVSSFSALLEKLSRHKDLTGGSERLSYLITVFLGGVVDTIIAHGGDIVQFAGDAFLAVWRTNTSEKQSKSESKERLMIATQQAIACALLIQNTVGNTTMNDGIQTIELKMRIEIGAGEIVGMHCGENGRWQYMVLGAEVENTYDADHLNVPGKVLLTRAAKNLVEKTCLTQQKNDQEVFEVERMTIEVPTKSREVPVIPTGLEAALGRYVPSHVLGMLKAKQIDWLTEIRNVTMVFVALPKSPLPATDKEQLDHMQLNLKDVILATEKYQGMLAHLSSDDKGIFAVIVLGIPSHEDDALRGVSTAVDIFHRFEQRKLVAHIGVSSGITVSCSVGSRSRSQFTLYGATVNLAARLMAISPKIGESILCDEVSTVAARGRFAFRKLDPIELKGFGKVTSFAPETKLNWNVPKTITTTDTKILGRTAELDTFQQAMQSIATKYMNEKTNKKIEVL